MTKQETESFLAFEQQREEQAKASEYQSLFQRIEALEQQVTQMRDLLERQMEIKLPEGFRRDYQRESSDRT